MAVTYGTTTAFSNQAGLNGLTSAAQVSLGVIDNTTELADDYLIDVLIKDVAETGNRQVLIFARSSVDGTSYSDATATALNLVPIGRVDLNVGANDARSIAMPIAAAFGGSMPPKVEIYARNDAGVTLAGSGNLAQYRSVKYG